MDINQASQKVEDFLAGYAGRGGKTAKEIRVHPSGDDARAIKVWVDLGGGVSDADCDAWARQCELDASSLVEDWALQVRAESL